MTGEARACFSRAAGAALTVDAYDNVDSPTAAEALRAYGLLCRRERRYADAADAWRRILALRGCPARIAQEATEALAVHHEHRVRDLRSARRFAMHALEFSASATRVQAVQRRLARIERKLGVPPPQPAPLPLDRPEGPVHDKRPFAGRLS